MTWLLSEFTKKCFSSLEYAFVLMSFFLPLILKYQKAGNKIYSCKFKKNTFRPRKENIKDGIHDRAPHMTGY